MPELQDSAADGADGAAVAVFTQAAEAGDDGASLWDDDQTAAFYQDLPDVQAFVPHLAAEATATGEADAADSAAAQPDAGGQATSDVTEQGARPEVSQESETTGPGDSDAAAAAQSTTDSAEAEAARPQDTSDPNYAALKRIFEQLAACNSAGQADDIAISFCFIQTKGATARSSGDLLTGRMQSSWQGLRCDARERPRLALHSACAL